MQLGQLIYSNFVRYSVVLQCRLNCCSAHIVIQCNFELGATLISAYCTDAKCMLKCALLLALLSSASCDVGQVMLCSARSVDIKILF